MAKETADYRWHFALQPKGGEQGPNVATKKSFAGDKYVTLVREAIQNSLDAPLDTTNPVRVELAVKSVKRNNLASFFDIENHIKACLSSWSKNPNAEETFKPMLDYLKGIDTHDNLHYIEVADYNTTGMYYKKGDRTTPFFSFLMSVGNSSKNDQNAGGSFGFGKAAYFNVSKIATILVSTRTARGQSFFEGVSSLCTHEMNGTTYTSFGYFGNNGWEPVQREEDIPVRFKRYEPGTTFCIMGIDAKEGKEKEAIYNEIRLAVLRNFWLSIYKGKLAVKVGDVEITCDNVRAMVEQNFPDEEDKGRKNNINPRPYFKAVADTETDKHCRKIEKNIAQLGHVELYAFRQNGAKGKLLFMREPRMLVYYERMKGFYGVFVCDDPGGNRILRRMENMRHDEWDPKNCPEDSLLREQGRTAKEALDTFIRECIEALLPTKKDNLREIQNLKEYLYIPTAAEADDDFDTESLVGEAVDVKDDEGGSPTTVVKNEGKASSSEKKQTTGQVLVDDPAPAPHRPDPNGKHHGGHGKGKKGGGGGTTRNNTSGVYTPDPNGIGGSTKIQVPISYRSFAFSLLGKTMHRLVIRCEKDITDGELKIFIGGEQSKEEPTIAWSSEGIIEENSVKGVVLVAQQKKNIDLQFADDMKYALIVTAYES